MVQTGLRWMRNDWDEMALPIVLVLTGLFLLGGDLLGVLSLERIQNYWPVAVIVIGLAELAAEPNRTAGVSEKHVRQL